MKSTILAIILATLPIAAAAQDGPAPQTAGPDADLAASTAPSSDADMQRPTFRRGRQTQRPSMVGFVDDATIGSGVRIRYESSWDLEAPDRAEFFYAKCGCYRSGIPELDPSAPGPGPGIVTSLDAHQLSMLTERGSGRMSVFVELPYRWIDPVTFAPGTGSFTSDSGLGDIRVGTKIAIASSASRTITAMVRGSVPTGDSTKGLGTDHATIEPALLIRQTLGGRAQIEGMFGDRHPLGSATGQGGSGNFAGDVLYYGVGPSFDLVETRNVRFGPVVELLGWHLLGGLETTAPVAGPAIVDASGTNILDLTFGARAAMANGGSFYAGYAITLTANAWFDHTLRVEYRTKF